MKVIEALGHGDGETTLQAEYARMIDEWWDRSQRVRLASQGLDFTLEKLEARYDVRHRSW